MRAVVGLGSPHGDDQLGWLAIDLLRSRLPEGVPARKVAGGLDLLECLDGRDEVIIVDASAPAGRPGAVRVIEWPGAELDARAPLGSHGLGLVEALQMAEALGCLPRRVVIVAVEAQDAPPLGPVSRAGAIGAADAARVVLREFDREVWP